MRTKRVQPVRVTRLVNELNLKGVVREYLNNRSDLACDKTQFGQIGNERYGVEKMDGWGIINQCQSDNT